MNPATTPGSLGAVIRRRRTELGWSQEDLAARASGDGDELRQSDISRLECGRVGLPRRARLVRIAAALGLSPGDLLARSGWMGADRAREFGTAPAAIDEPGVAPLDARAATAPPAAFAEREPARVDAGQVAHRLRQAIDEAQATRARSEQALRRADEVLAYAEGPRRPVRG